MGSLIFASFLGNQQIFAQGEISNIEKNLCEKQYDSYKKLGTENLIGPPSEFLNSSDCFKLFEDPNWNFAGKDQIDRYYERSYQIISYGNPLIANHDNHFLEIKNISKLKIGYEKYSLTFRICSESQAISEPKFFVVTDKEYYLAKSKRVLDESSCNFVKIYTNAHDTGKIFFLPFDGNYVPSKYLKVKLFN